VIPNLSFVAMTRAQLDDLRSVLDDPEAAYLAPAVREMWERQNPTTRGDLDRFDRRERAKYPFLLRLTAALHGGGVPLLLGTDASAPGLFPGKSAHVELRELVKAGLTPYQALSAATRTPGEFIARHFRSEPVGTITPGARADMILLRANPLDDIANAQAIEGVFVAGRWTASRAEPAPRPR
jgi:imidazolonepropionase-like amidohydrolase